MIRSQQGGGDDGGPREAWHSQAPSSHLDRPNPDRAKRIPQNHFHHSTLEPNQVAPPSPTSGSPRPSTGRDFPKRDKSKKEGPDCSGPSREAILIPPKLYCTLTRKNWVPTGLVTENGDVAGLGVQGPNRLVAWSNVPWGQLN